MPEASTYDRAVREACDYVDHGVLTVANKWKFVKGKTTPAKLTS